LSTSCQSGDLEQLRATFPGWDIEAHWTVAGTGPDARYLIARKGDVTLQAWNAGDLAAQIAAAAPRGEGHRGS
jgi:hypothetical protein